jgi:hypothetical protein
VRHNVGDRIVFATQNKVRRAVLDTVAFATQNKVRRLVAYADVDARCALTSESVHAYVEGSTQ